MDPVLEIMLVTLPNWAKLEMILVSVPLLVMNDSCNWMGAVVVLEKVPAVVRVLH